MSMHRFRKTKTIGGLREIRNRLPFLRTPLPCQRAGTRSCPGEGSAGSGERGPAAAAAPHRAGYPDAPLPHASAGLGCAQLDTEFGSPLTYLYSKDQRNITAVQLKSHPTFSKTICGCRSLNSYFGERGGKLKNRHCQQVPSSGGLCRQGGETRGEGEEEGGSGRGRGRLAGNGSLH